MEFSIFQRKKGKEKKKKQFARIALSEYKSVRFGKKAERDEKKERRKRKKGGEKAENGSET